MASTVKVAVTGAAGAIGYAILPRIASGQMFGPDTRVRLSLPAARRRVATRAGLRFAGAMFNVYVVSTHQDPEPAHWVTELCLPVAPVGA